MSKQKEEVKYITCCHCGGSEGTLRKKEVIYEHMRPEDCARHKAKSTKTAEIMKQVIPAKE